VFLVSHNNKSIRDTCDRVLWLERGVLRMDGPTEDVLAEYEKFTGK
jgi:teichoic acid transport system ATP-binding protein